MQHKINRHGWWRSLVETAMSIGPATRRYRMYQYVNIICERACTMVSRIWGCSSIYACCAPCVPRRSRVISLLHIIRPDDMQLLQFRCVCGRSCWCWTGRCWACRRVKLRRCGPSLIATRHCTCPTSVWVTTRRVTTTNCRRRRRRRWMLATTSTQRGRQQHDCSSHWRCPTHSHSSRAPHTVWCCARGHGRLIHIMDLIDGAEYVANKSRGNRSCRTCSTRMLRGNCCRGIL